MPRTPREKSETGIYHVMMRGVNKQIIFNDVEDKHRFILILNKYKNLNKYQVYSYCLMDNHIHLLMQELDDDISRSIQKICSAYVWWYNKKYDRIGHLFQSRFKSEVVNSEGYLLNVMRYIHNNPIKAGIASHPEKYQWSSYIEYTKEGPVVDSDFILNILSDNRKIALKLFKDYHDENEEYVCLDINKNKPLTDNDLATIIKRLNINIDEIQNLDIVNRDNILRELKCISGTSIRQISRLTGVPKSVIGRV